MPKKKASSAPPAPPSAPATDAAEKDGGKGGKGGGKAGTADVKEVKDAPKEPYRPTSKTKSKLFNGGIIQSRKDLVHSAVVGVLYLCCCGYERVLACMRVGPMVL